MAFHIGEKVIHASFGFAEVVNIENKVISGDSRQYYVVKTKEMLIWVPTSENKETKLRPPSSMKDLQECFKILKSKYSPFSSDRHERKSLIQDKIHHGSIHSLCEVIRDLSFYKVQNKINDSEKTLLEKSITHLLDEWGYAFQITHIQARNELNRLLKESYASSV